MESYCGEVWLARLLVQRGLAAIYLVAFVVVLRQFRPLLGEEALCHGVQKFRTRIGPG